MLSATFLKYIAGIPGCNTASCGLPMAQANNHALQSALGIVFGVVGGLALLMIVISGFRFVLARGNPERSAKARDGLIYALVGLAIAVAAESIVFFVIGNLA